ncbi:hypothetical protein Tco_1138898, partial [Tanacetum coccineum]
MDKETLQELTVSIEDAPLSADKEKLQEVTVTNRTPSSSTPSSSLPKPKTGRFRRCKSFIHQMGGFYGLLFGHLTKTFMLKKNFNQLSAMLYEALKEMLPSMVNKEANKIAKMTVPIYVAKGLLLERQKIQADVAAMIFEAIKKERDNLCVEVISQFGQAMEQDPNPSSSGTQEQLDKFDAWMEDVGTDDEVPKDKESKKERLTLPTPNKKALVVHSCQRDLKAPPMTLLNQDLFYLKHGNSGLKKYILSLH